MPQQEATFEQILSELIIVAREKGISSRELLDGLKKHAEAVQKTIRGNPTGWNYPG